MGRLKRWRDLATRYAKRVAVYRAGVVVAALVLWLAARSAEQQALVGLALEAVDGLRVRWTPSTSATRTGPSR